ncbi:unnamed protein product [Periconia digitata]|uniref:Uncharacterized protein n=1 Tax=Periconia digitata TaxID=1303443 RepID=A0A9W4UL06_9PLEO|nr:unnamed protein product [Periconia digitata]
MQVIGGCEILVIAQNSVNTNGLTQSNVFGGKQIHAPQASSHNNMVSVHLLAALQDYTCNSAILFNERGDILFEKSCTCSLGRCDKLLCDNLGFHLPFLGVP